jgi:predicted membrane metal-binding protein
MPIHSYTYGMAIGDIAFGITAAFLAGVLAASLGWQMGLFASFVFVAGLIVLLVKKSLRLQFRRLWKFALLFFATIIFGAFYYHFFLHWQAARENLPIGNSADFSAIVADEPKVSASGDYLYFPAATQSPYSGEVMVFMRLSAASADSSVRYGDLLQIKGQVLARRNPGDSVAAFPKTLTVLAEHRGFWLRAAMLDFKTAVLNKFREFLSPDAAALLGSVTFGGTDGTGAALKNEMALSGTSYVTSMYGYKMYVVAWAIEEALKRRLARHGRFALVALSIMLFTAMAGAAVVVIRAAIFALLALLAREVGRPLSKRNALAVVAAGMAAFDPTIVTQFSFVLSFLSVAGIMYLMGPLKKLLRWNRDKAGTAISAGIFRWRESVLIAAAVLLAIIPVIVADSAAPFSLAIFASNALIGIATPIAVGFGYALALIGFLPGFLSPASHALGVIVAKFANLVLFYDFAIIKIFAAFTVPMPLYFNSLAAFVIYYGGLIWFVWEYRETAELDKIRN